MKIEKNIPAPPKSGKGNSASEFYKTLKLLKIGESFLTTDKEYQRAYQRVYNYCNPRNSTKLKEEFIVSKLETEEYFRVWRIK